MTKKGKPENNKLGGKLGRRNCGNQLEQPRKKKERKGGGREKKDIRRVIKPRCRSAVIAKKQLGNPGGKEGQHTVDGVSKRNAAAKGGERARGGGTVVSAGPGSSEPGTGSDGQRS